jgi:phospho-N-acetylmuramoyl-pentapeptide-transferase
VIGLLIALFCSTAVSLTGTKFLIGYLGHKKAHQPILANDQKNAPAHQHKAGTPSMGGLAIVVAAAVGYMVPHVRPKIYFTNTALLVMMAVLGAGAVGLADDLLKIRRARNLGLTKRAKSLGLLAIGTTFSILMVVFTDVSTKLSFTRLDLPGWELTKVGWVILAIVVIQSTSNAVNLTDGLDGLAAGSATLTFAALVIIAYWGFRYPRFYQYPHGYDLSLVAVSMMGGCIGFLWWNAAPAKIFMGDAGALAIGTAMATLALSTNTVLLLPILGALYVAETMSVMMQFTSYRYFGKRRIFRMAPIHHHFELKGWPETTVIIRFWLVSGMFTALGLGLYYADWVSIGGIQ